MVLKNFFVGADVSTLHELTNLGAKFYDFDGKQTELLPFLITQGVSSVRLRLWVDPYENGECYGAGTCDLPTVLSLAKKAKSLGMTVMLDLHYSDFWTDPGKQIKPKAWQNAHGKELVTLASSYTESVLTTFKKEGVDPEYIQVGNEITNGMMWPDGQLVYDPESKRKNNFDGLCAILSGCIAAVRRVSAAKVVLHLENSGSCDSWQEWCDNVFGRGIDCDILGGSYYAFWHGTMEHALKNISDTAKKHGKIPMLVESSFAFTRELYGEDKRTEGCKDLVVGTEYTDELEYPTTPEGQVAYVRDLLKLCKKYDIESVYYWEIAWIPVKGTSWATNASLRYMHEEGKGLGNEWANQALFDYDGKPLQALKEIARAVKK